ncbi:hypothetical protein [Mucilaginibacter sp. OK098]|uniref:hypothetical protein n=1 Tax=Mucilaginibacter sp. OK098 TaxID=1855297 RepID=UPI00091E5629|nr:hypothetical protein [Mucilaginibacter sp. OK098]SHN31206.1 hypothetical protein SAMN05216524_109131 [Mucilaginibacter sp. OK098]
MSNIDLIPNVSVGQLKFGESIKKYLKYEHTYFKKDVNDIYMEDNYEFIDPPIIVFVNSSNKISSITCNVGCFWKGENLIGFPINEFIKLSGIEPDRKEKLYVMTAYNKGQRQDVYDFESLGLQIWVWKNKIVTVGCTNYDLD